MSDNGIIRLRTLDIKSLRACLPLDNDRQLPPASQSLGSFAVLPTELFHDILADVDILTLVAFRQVNRLARVAVDNVPEYTALFQSHRNVLRAVVASQASAYSCRELHAELRNNTQCRGCGDDATHLYLITCRLLCQRCFAGDWRAAVPPPSLSSLARRMYGSEYPYVVREDPSGWNRGVAPLHHPFQDYVPLQDTHAIVHCSDITPDEIAQIPHILSLPARYQSGNEWLSTGARVKLYDTRTLLARYELSDCHCMRSYPEVMRRYQAVIALRETTEEEEGHVPIGTVRDPFEPSYREVWML